MGTIYQLNRLIDMGTNDERFNDLLEDVKTRLRNLNSSSQFDCIAILRGFIHKMAYYAIRGGGVTSWIMELFDIVLQLQCRDSIYTIINNVTSDLENRNLYFNSYGLLRESPEIWLRFINDVFDEYEASNVTNIEISNSLYDFPSDAFGEIGVNDYISSYANRPSVNIDFSRLRSGDNPIRRARSPRILPRLKGKKSRSPQSFKKKVT